MAVVPITINGVAYPKQKSADMKPIPVTIVGHAWITGLHVGGGPLPDAHPEHPIVLPDPPVEPPIDQPPPEHPLDEMLTLVAKEPPKEGGWGWFPEYGWVYSKGEGQSGPKRK